MASNNTTTTTGSTAGLDIDWDNLPAIPVVCEKCGAAFDAVDDGHGWRCTVCQDLFGLDIPPKPSNAADTTPAGTTPGLKEGHLACKTCKASFRPTAKNNGADCTKCCNRQASEGYDVFARYNQKMTAIAPIATMRRTTFSAAPIFSAQHVTTAPMPRKRAAESANEQLSQQNEPTAKRSKTSQQQQATTMPTENAETLPTAARQTTPPGEYGTGFRNMLQAAINQMDDKSTK